MGSRQQEARAGNGGVAAFASEVVALLVKGEVGMTLPLREDLIERLMQAVCSATPTDLAVLRTLLRRARVSPAVFAERYLPEIARRLGRAWEDDRMSFAEVTLGTARLQALLRQIGAGAEGEAFVADDESWASVLLIVPEGQQHMLGAFVLLGHLRRRGMSVCLRLGPSADDLRALLAERRFDAAMVSLALPDHLAPTCAMLRLLKKQTGGRMPVALGGAALTLSDITVPQDCADIVTNDLASALAALGLVGARPPLTA